MSSLTIEMNNSQVVEELVDSAPPFGALDKVLSEVAGIVPPLWTLRDYVAVNPCVGLTGEKFLHARQILTGVRDCQFLMPRDYFQSLWREKKLTRAEIETAHAQCTEEYPDWYADCDLEMVFDWLNGVPLPLVSERRFHTVAEKFDRRWHSHWTSHIINDISRHCGAHYDQGQAVWSSPWKGESLYTAWHSAARMERRMDMLGLTGFRTFVEALPASPREAIRELLHRGAVPYPCWQGFLLCQLFSVAGWASFIRCRVRGAEIVGQQDEDLLGLLAIRLAYDLALAELPEAPPSLDLWPAAEDPLVAEEAPQLPPVEVLARYTLQVAAERAYQQSLCRQLNRAQAATPVQKALQIVFCIDVRSEVMRRHLESVNAAIETFGFAGFFGMPLEYVSLGATKGVAQCPVLLQPGFRVQESVLGASEDLRNQVTQTRRQARLLRKVWKSFQTSAVSCFSFVESLGLTYFSKLLTDSLGLTRPVAPADRDGVPSQGNWRLGPNIYARENSGLSPQRRIDLAEGMLRNLGLTEGFAPLVVLCGHAAEVTNNPYQAALDCGACGGHSGESNARVAAALLNDAEVRRGLARRGITIPSETWFTAAVHNTTTDQIRFCDAQLIPASHGAKFLQVQEWVAEAGRLTRTERSQRFGAISAEDVLRKSGDWAEVRPEWGLAGNSALIVAPRTRTSQLNLGGRTFMHSYDYRRDPELKTLELIMTAPLVVANWINFQYYASTVDPRAFGSGNKLIHNVVGQFGIFEGNGGDLMTGLPWQCLHDGKKLQHEPLRLLAVIEAPRASVQRIIEKHSLVRDLVTKGWVSLVVIDQEQFYRWTSRESWEAQLTA